MYKKLMMLMLVGIFMIGIVSAWDLSLDNTKIYNETTKTVEIWDKNIFLVPTTLIGTATLKTPQVNYVMHGKNRLVYEIELTNVYEARKVIDNLETFNAVDMKPIDRKITWKYGTVAYNNITDYIHCTIKDGVSCKDTPIGSHLESYRVWNLFDEKTVVPKGIVYLGGFADVNYGDRVEWIPTLFGERIEEWAEWTSAINVSLEAYWNMNNTEDNLVRHNLTLVLGSLIGQSGGVNGLKAFTDGVNDYVKMTNETNLNISTALGFTYNFWFNTLSDSATGSYKVFYTMLLSTGNTMRLISYGNKPYLNLMGGGCSAGANDLNCGASCDAVNSGNWMMITVRINGTGASIWQNGVQKISADVTGCAFAPALNTSIFGAEITSALSVSRQYNASWDEMAIWQRALTDTEIATLYDGGTGTFYSSGGAPPTPTPINTTVTLISPINNTNYSTTTAKTFSANATATNGNVTNFTLYIWGGGTTTNTTTGFTGTFNSTSWQMAKTDGVYTWNVLGCATNLTSSECVWGSANRTFTIDSTPPVITIVNPINQTYQYGNTSINITTNEAASLCWFNASISGLASEILVGADSTHWNRASNLTIIAGSQYIIAYCNDTFGNLGTATRYYSGDTVAPVVNILLPVNGSTTYNQSTSYGTNLNVSITDSGPLDSCWYYNITNSTITCRNNVSINLGGGWNTLGYYANDSFNNVGSNFTTFFLNLYSVSTKIPTPIMEGMNFVVKFNITATDITTTTANITFNGTTTQMSLSSNNGTLAVYTATLSAPNVAISGSFPVVINYTLNARADGFAGSVEVYDFAVDNCSAFTTPLFNLTVYDEDSLAMLNEALDNVTIELSFTFKNSSGSTVLGYSNISYFKNPFKLCFNTSIGETTYRLDGVIRYEAREKFSEYYYLQNYSVTNSSLGLNIPLYDLNSTLGQEFKITYKDANFVPVANALINIQRQYISKGLFRTVEIPKTGTEGHTIGHLLINNAIYNIIVYQEGRILATFENVIAACQLPTIETCTINLNSYGSGTAPSDFTNANGVTFTLTYNSTMRDIATTFVITSGAASTIDLNVTLFDNLGNQTVCANSVYSSGGSLNCTIPTAFGNGTVIAKLYKDGVEFGIAIIKLKQNPADIYGNNLIIIAMLLFLILVGIGASSDSPMLMGVMLVLGSIVMIGLNLIYTPSVFGVGATILWFVIATVLVIIKGVDRT